MLLRSDKRRYIWLCKWCASRVNYSYLVLALVAMHLLLSPQPTRHYWNRPFCLVSAYCRVCFVHIRWQLLSVLAKTLGKRPELCKLVVCLVFTPNKQKHNKSRFCWVFSLENTGKVFFFYFLFFFSFLSTNMKLFSYSKKGKQSLKNMKFDIVSWFIIWIFMRNIRPYSITCSVSKFGIFQVSFAIFKQLNIFLRIYWM